MRSGYKQTGVGVIPEEWDVPHLRQHLLQDSTYGVVKAGAFLRSGIPMIRSGEIKNGTITEGQLLISPGKHQEYARTILKGSDVVIALVGYPGEAAVVPERLIGANISRAVGLLRPTSNLTPEFLVCYLNSPNGRREFLRPSAGSAQIVVNLGALNKLLLPLPPIREQRAIAQALYDIDSLITTLDQLIAKKRDIKQATMQQLLTGKTRLPGFNGKWELKKFGAVAAPRRERIDPRRDGSRDFCIELEHIESASGHILGSTSTGDHSSLKSVFYDGDVLFGKLRAYLRKYWLATQRGVCSTEIWVLVPRAEAITSEFLFQVIQTEDFIDAASNSYGTHMPRSDWNVVRNYEFNLPTLPEQDAIAAVLSDMDAELSALEARRDKTRALKQGMMQELLTGKTRLI